MQTQSKSRLTGSIAFLKRWLRFNRLYYLGQPPWDTGISPPELKAVIEGERRIAAGTALDLGCGTGTNALYMAVHGWQVVGVDYAPQAVRLARRKARSQNLAARFYWGSVTQLPMLKSTFDLLLDIGCFHGLDEVGRAKYAAELVRLSQPGTLYLLYAFAPSAANPNSVGVTPAQIQALFEPAFQIEEIVEGADSNNGRVSSWYTMHRR